MAETGNEQTGGFFFIIVLSSEGKSLAPNQWVLLRLTIVGGIKAYQMTC